MPHRAAQFSSYVYLINYLHIEIAKLHCRVYYQPAFTWTANALLFFLVFLRCCYFCASRLAIASAFSSSNVGFLPQWSVCVALVGGRGSHNNINVFMCSFERAHAVSLAIYIHGHYAPSVNRDAFLLFDSFVVSLFVARARSSIPMKWRSHHLQSRLEHYGVERARFALIESTEWMCAFVWVLRSQSSVFCCCCCCWLLCLIYFYRIFIRWNCSRYVICVCGGGWCTRTKQWNS